MDLGDLIGDLDLDVDRAREVVDLVWDNKDELAKLLAGLPALLADLGDHLVAAGEGAARAGAFLSDDVQELAGSAADTLVSSQARLEVVGDALGKVGRMLDDVPLLGDVGDVLADGLQALAGVVEDLDVVAAQVRGLGDKLAEVGGDLDGTGRSLEGGGTALATFSRGPKAKGKAGGKAGAKPAAKPKAGAKGKAAR